MRVNYYLQIEKLKELNAYLNQFNTEVQSAANNYRAKLSALIEQGLPAEPGKKFTDDFFQQSKNLLDRNSAVINEQAIPFVVRNIQGLEQLIGR